MPSVSLNIARIVFFIALCWLAGTPVHAGIVTGNYWYLGIANDQAAEQDEAQSLLDSFREYRPWKDTPNERLHVRNNLGGAAILSELKHFHDNVKPGDTFVFYYGGHSSRIEDDNKDEPDGMDELIGLFGNAPDYASDDQLASNPFFGSFPECSTVIVIMNTCRTGGFIDGTDDLNREAIKKKKNLLFMGATDADELCGPQHRTFNTDVVRALEMGLESDNQTHAKEWGQILKRIWEKRGHTLAYADNLDVSHDHTVFATVPEASSVVMCSIGTLCICFWTYRRKSGARKNPVLTKNVATSKQRLTWGSDAV